MSVKFLDLNTNRTTLCRSNIDFNHWQALCSSHHYESISQTTCAFTRGVSSSASTSHFQYPYQSSFSLKNMDSQQTAALNALAPFAALSTSATSPRAAADLISQATSAPNTYVFAELLQTPNIQALRSAETQYARWLRALEIFSWGTWSEYQGKQTPHVPSPAKEKGEEQ